MAASFPLWCMSTVWCSQPARRAWLLVPEANRLIPQMCMQAPPGATLEVPNPEQDSGSGMDNQMSENTSQRRYR